MLPRQIHYSPQLQPLRTTTRQTIQYMTRRDVSCYPGSHTSRTGPESQDAGDAYSSRCIGSGRWRKDLQELCERRIQGRVVVTALAHKLGTAIATHTRGSQLPRYNMRSEPCCHGLLQTYRGESTWSNCWLQEVSPSQSPYDRSSLEQCRHHRCTLSLSLHLSLKLSFSVCLATSLASVAALVKRITARIYILLYWN